MTALDIKKTFILFLLLSIAVCFLVLQKPGILNAQISSLSENLSMTVYPKHPLPNTQAKVHIESYLTDLKRANMSWYVNGSLALKGVGEKDLQLTLGGLGSATRVSVIIQTSEGSIIEKEMTIRPASVDLIWEVDSYRPPFYKGKSYFPYQGTIRVVAIPFIVGQDGSRINSNDLVFTWKKGDRVIGSESGVGVDTFIAEGDIPIRETVVSVEVRSFDDIYVAEKTIVVKPTSPTILFYRNDPFYGIMFNSALSNPFSFSSDEIEITSIPYSFNAERRNDPNILFSWSMNGTALPVSGAGQSELVLRNEGNRSGQSLVSLRASHRSRIFQFADNDIRIQFGENSGN
ncbi:MAG: hypothetical protein COV70_04245 [Parcubacteria group bacterium CG11_big_fil_rev_8_21_14_0_20_39_22]|nr:MAG: hypothetical protein COV70_04245 [Parcubacteria group bacterium CG11_big_fil_rev_8_21_14_0_20_39_22]